MAQVEQQQEGRHEHTAFEQGMAFLSRANTGASQCVLSSQTATECDSQENERHPQPGLGHLCTQADELPGHLAPVQHAPEQEEGDDITLPGRILAGKHQYAGKPQHDAIFTTAIKMRAEDEQHQGNPPPAQHALQGTALIRTHIYLPTATDTEPARTTPTPARCADHFPPGCYRPAHNLRPAPPD